MTIIIIVNSNNNNICSRLLKDLIELKQSWSEMDDGTFISMQKTWKDQMELIFKNMKGLEYVSKFFF